MFPLSKRTVTETLGDGDAEVIDFLSGVHGAALKCLFS